ncbi:MAG: hypothetical protein H0V29_13450 [Thermoleophilaceae bacterium]|nr:hypothetical protein [Thermoleophilaceae bacterium]
MLRAEEETVSFPEEPLEYRPPGEPGSTGEQEELPGLEEPGEDPTTRLPPGER